MKRTPPKGSEGQVLAGVILVMLCLLIMVPALVQWVQNESKLSVHDSKNTSAFNLAQAGVDRGMWMVKSSTQVCANAIAGIVPAGYKFDVTYSDVPGGTYRISISSAGNKSVTIVGEGRDTSTNVIRSISAVYQNATIYGPLMSQQTITLGKGMAFFWGPIMSQGDILIRDQLPANMYFPRKYARGTVFTGPAVAAADARDTNGLTPPNTDGVEWSSDYQAVPDVPMIDFVALRSSAAATGTLNVYGCKNSATHSDGDTTVAGAAPWDGRASCTNTGSHALHFAASANYTDTPHVAGNGQGIAIDPNPAQPPVWYYDGDLILAGASNATNANDPRGVGLRGTLIVRGNLTLDAPGNYNYTGPVPVNAWQDEQKLTRTTFDTGTKNEYPADNGFHQTLSTWQFGTQSSCIPGAPGCTWVNTVGMRGFTYVGGDLTITNNGFMDFNGAVWVNGNVIANGASVTSFCGVYYDDSLTVPTLNVILIRQSWREVSPSATPWP